MKFYFNASIKKFYRNLVSYERSCSSKPDGVTVKLTIVTLMQISGK